MVSDDIARADGHSLVHPSPIPSNPTTTSSSATSSVAVATGAAASSVPLPVNDLGSPDYFSRPLNLFTASAGSGKTWRLAYEYIALLLRSAKEDADPDGFRHILAITFTNKATAEMKSRVLDYLHMLMPPEAKLRTSAGEMEHYDDKERSDYLSNLASRLGMAGDLGQVALLAQRVYFVLLHDYSHFAVRTIDSFFNTILQNMSHELGLNGNQSLELNDQPVLQQAVHNMLGSLASDQSLALSVGELVDSGIEEQNGRWDVEGVLCTSARCLFNEQFLAHEASRSFMRTSNDPVKVVRSLQAKLKAFKNKCRDEMESVARSLQSVVSSLPGGEADMKKFMLERIMSVAAGKHDKLACDTLIDIYRGGANAEALREKCFKGPAAKSAAYDGMAMQIASLFSDGNDWLRRSAQADALARSLSRMSVLANIWQEIHRLQDEGGFFLLSLTQPLLRGMVDGSDAPFIYEKIGTRLMQIMIDEFQDTGRLQFSNIRPLLQDCCSSFFGSLIVGDAKQSIYRFRNGDWHLIDSLRNQALGLGSGASAAGEDFSLSLPVCLHSMGQNFRSRRNVVSFNNAVFCADHRGLPSSLFCSMASDGLADFSLSLRSLTSIYSASAQDVVKKGEGGMVKVFLVPKPDDGGGCEAGPDAPAAGAQDCDDDFDDASSMSGSGLLVSELLRQHNDCGVDYSDMLMLFDNNKQIADYALLLKNNGIPVVSSMAFTLVSSVKVLLVVDCMRYISRLGSVSVSERQRNVDRKAVEYGFVRYRLLEGGDGDFSPEEALSGLQPDLDGFFDSVSGPSGLGVPLVCLPIYDLAEELCRRLFPGLPTDEYLQTFLDGVRSFVGGNKPSLDDFLDFWDASLQKRAIPSSSQQQSGIELLTIHKSKGLQKHTVIIPCASWAMEKSRNVSVWVDLGKALRVLDPSDGSTFRDLPPDLPLVSVPYRRDYVSGSVFSDEMAQEQADMHIDNVNKLYVALTRPEANLLVFINDSAACDEARKESKANPVKDVGYYLWKSVQGYASQTGTVQEVEADGTISYTFGSVSASKAGLRADGTATEASAAPTLPDICRQKGRFRQSSMSALYMRTRSFSNGSDARAEAMARGTAFHRVMEGLDTVADVDDPAEEIGRSVSAMSQAGDLKADDGESLKADAVARFLALDRPYRFGWFGRGLEVLTEQTLLSSCADELSEVRPDRVVLDPVSGRYTVVDYKTGRQHPSHLRQVRHYVELVRQLSPGSTVDGFLWYVDSAKVVRV